MKFLPGHFFFMKYFRNLFTYLKYLQIYSLNYFLFYQHLYKIIIWKKMYLNQQLSSLIYLHHLLVIYFFLIYDADTRVLWYLYIYLMLIQWFWRAFRVDKEVIKNLNKLQTTNLKVSANFMRLTSLFRRQWCMLRLRSTWMSGGYFFRAELIGLFRARATSVIFDSVGVSNLRRKGSSGVRWSIFEIEIIVEQTQTCRS